MSVIISEGQIIGALMKFLHDRLAAEHQVVKMGLEPAVYMRCCGRIEAYDKMLAEARDLIKKANNGLTDDEEENA